MLQFLSAFYCVPEIQTKGAVYIKHTPTPLLVHVLGT